MFYVSIKKFPHSDTSVIFTLTILPTANKVIINCKKTTKQTSCLCCNLTQPNLTKIIKYLESYNCMDLEFPLDVGLSNI